MTSDLLHNEIERQKKYLAELPETFNFPLFNTKRALESQRQNGYKNTAVAAREIVDNAMEAKASKVHVIFDTRQNNTREAVSSVAFIDNGSGMIPLMARYSLSWGGGTHFDDPNFIGKFGFGLPNASINQTRIVEVYTRTAKSERFTKVRHTWVNSYKSVPGRSMMILVRDAAAPHHPVIGIASLGSAVVQQSVRDKWIGWDSAGVMEQLKALPQKKVTSILLNELGRFTREVYIKDLLADRLLTRSDLRNPSDAVITRLLKESAGTIQQHRRYPHSAKQKQTENLRQTDWRMRAENSLFRSKRCKLLATLLSIRRTFTEFGICLRNPQAVRDAYEKAKFRFAVGQLFRLAKGERVGIKMMDIMVCGSIAPYSSILGGKLICYLLCSPEIVKHYEKRYGGQTSLIASSMSGKAVKRPATLVLLCATSLYGSALSQYSRVKVPAGEVGGTIGDKVEFENLGLSEGFGVFHFSRETLRLINLLVSRAKEYRKVNSIFGEGVNPLMRKIREGLSKLGLPAEVLLKHGNKRVVYGVGLASNFRKVLLGLSTKPHYIIPQTKPRLRTEELSEYWRRRWLLKRLNKAGILEEVAKHTLVYPIQHGAQVYIPVDADPILPLWT